MSKYQPPLFDLFIFMRETAGLPLTIDQYYLLVQALHGGFGINSRNELKKICRLLWIKSIFSAQATRFDEYFEQYFARNSHNSQPEVKNQNSNLHFKEKLPKDGKPNDFKPSPEETEPSTSEPRNSPSPNYPKIPTAIRGGEFLPETPFRQGRYQLNLQDFPLTQRQIQQNWRYLRRAIREGPLTEIDIEATVKQIIADGVFLEPVLIPSRINRVEMLLLIDDSNSMIPFRILCQRICATLKESRLGKADTYYFLNCPREHLYLYPRRPDTRKIKEILPKLHRNRTIILIISDAGAARGGINSDRIEMTKDFIHQFTPYVRHVAWLNPMPRERWEYTSAEFIDQFVQMFEINPQGFKSAIKSLKI